jgi:putative acetyltransferase
MTLLIRPEGSDDYAAIKAVVAAAFKSDAEAELVDLIRASPQYIPALALVADDDGEIVGHVMISYAELIDGDARHRLFQLAPLAVEPERHGRGVGGALVRESLARAEAMGAPLVALQGDPNYYGRFGFEPAVAHGITMDLPEWAPAEAAQVKPLAGNDGSVRGHVVLPPSFDAVE